MKKKVLIVDDSALMRRVLSDIINLDERFHVSKVAFNGLEAYNLLVNNNEVFDAIILDINMPKMNGLEFLSELDKKNIKATVIIVSTIAKEGEIETIRALELGAFDFITKPESFYDIKSDSFKNKIIDCLVMATKLYEVSVKDITVEKPKETKNLVSKKTVLNKPIRPIQNSTTKNTKLNRLLVITCSTGGPKALQQVVPHLPDNLDCSVLIVQHMPEGFTLSLATRLNELSRLKVKEAEHGDVLEKGVVYLAKGGSQMRLKSFRDGSSKLLVTVEEARKGLKPCADILFESLIESDFDMITCVVLTGMGSDGTLGIKQLNEKKNIYVISQDEASCTVYGMPKVIAEAGLVDEIVPLNQIADAIIKNMEVR